MKFYQLSFRYLSRKKWKTILLFLILLIVSSMILSTNMILHATEKSKAEIQEKTKSKIVLETADTNITITNAEAEQIRRMNKVASVNCLTYHSAFPVDFNLITNLDSREKDNQKISLQSYDDLKNDSVFYEDQYRLISGSYIGQETNGGVVVNSLLADANGLKIGDEINLAAENKNAVSAKIIGIFVAGNEQKQTADTTSINRIENQIFIDNTTYSKLFENDGYRKLVVYSKNPDTLKELESELAALLHKKAEMTTSDTLYQQLGAPLEQISRVTRLMLILTFITGITVVSLLLCMWMRTRQKETGIFISLGKPKSSIYLQVLLEGLMVLSAGVLGACGLGSVMAEFLQSMLILSTTADITLPISLQFADIIALSGLGGLTVLISVSFSMFPILRSNPKETLSRMEG